MSTNQGVMAIAEKAEFVMNSTFSSKGEEFSYSLPEAMLIGINVASDGSVSLQPELASHADIYQLINNASKSTIQDFDAVGLVTCGWAAPISRETGEPEGAPSQHPERRRVRLFVCASRHGVASVLRFKDDVENPVFDEGEATGPLAEAVQSLFG